MPYNNSYAMRVLEVFKQHFPYRHSIYLWDTDALLNPALRIAMIVRHQYKKTNIDDKT